MSRLFKDNIDFIDMHKISTNNQEIILEIVQKNQETLFKINKQLELLEKKINKIENKIGLK